MSALVEYAESGNRLETLRKLRDKLAATIDVSDSGRDIAALSRQLTSVMEQIAELERIEAAKNDKEVPLNDILTKRKRRKAKNKSGA